MTLPDRIDAVRVAIVEGRVDEATALSMAIEAEAATLPPPDPRALSRSLQLLAAAVTGLRAAAARLARLRGEVQQSAVYDAKGKRQSHAPAQSSPRRW